MTELEASIFELSKTLSEGVGIETTEEALFEIVDMIRIDPVQKVQFLSMVEQSFMNRDPSGLSKNGVRRELVELATHELKWPEFEVLANKRIQDFFAGNEGLAISDVSNGVKQAYADDWEDREFFQSYAA